MMKLIVLAVIGLLVGIGGGSAVAVMNAKKAYAADVAHKASLVADSLAKAEEEGAKHVAALAHGADSTAEGAAASGDSAGATAHGAEGESAGHDAPARETAHAPAPAPAPAPATKSPKGYSRAVQTVESNGAPGSVSHSATRPTPPPRPIPTATPKGPPPGVSKVAKIFAAMPAKDAAMVLEQLEDAEVQSVISTLSEKQAAAILRNFPPARAATISKAVLRAALVQP